MCSKRCAKPRAAALLVAPADVVDDVDRDGRGGVVDEHDDAETVVELRLLHVEVELRLRLRRLGRLCRVGLRGDRLRRHRGGLRRRRGFRGRCRLSGSEAGDAKARQERTGQERKTHAPCLTPPVNLGALRSPPRTRRRCANGARMSPCPDEATILAFGRGDVNPATRRMVEQHVDECDGAARSSPRSSARPRSSRPRAPST